MPILASFLTVGSCLALPTTGASAPPLRFSKLLQAPPGARVDWRSLKGKTVILEFWATWCGPCVASIPHLNQLEASLDPQKFVFIAIDDEDAPVVEAFLQKKKMASWVGLDASGSTFKAFGVASRPSTIIVDKNGKIASITTADKITHETLITLASRESNVPVPRRIAESARASVAQSQGDPVVQDHPDPLFELRISPTTRTEKGFGMMHSTDGLRWGYMGVDARFLLSQAYSIPSRRIRFVDGEPGDLFDFFAGKASLDSSTFNSMIRAAIPAALCLTITVTKRSETALVLKPSPNPKSLQAAAPSEASYITFKEGKLLIANSSFDQVVKVLEGHLNTTVLNESGFQEKFDGELDLQSDDVTGVRAALVRAFGMDLVSETSDVQILQVSKAPKR